MAAYDQCWIFGDEFASHSYEQYFKSRASSDYNSYMKAHFDVRGFFNNMFSENPSVIGRMGNLMIHAVESKCDKKLFPFPKIVVIVPDDNIIKCFAQAQDDVIAKQIDRLLNYILTEHKRCIASYKDYLPAKSLRPTYPRILWIQAPEHECFTNNRLRYKFNRCLEELVKYHSNVFTLELKKSVEPQGS